jgi:DNA-binding transcriptional LysR family regulator
MPSQQAIQGVLDYQLDAAIIGGEVHDPELRCIPLTNEKLVLLSAQDAPMEDLLRKTLVVFQQGCSYRRRLEDIQTKYGIVPDSVMEMNSLGAILASVIAGLGVSLFPESTLASIQESRFHTVTELPYELADITVCLIHRKNGYLPSALREMAVCFQQESKSI